MGTETLYYEHYLSLQSIKIIKTPHGDGNLFDHFLDHQRRIILKSLKPRMGTETLIIY